MRRIFLGLLYFLSVFIVIFGTAFFIANTVSAAEMQISKYVEDNIDSVQSGEFFTYVIQYRCASITDDCEGMQIIDNLPSELMLESDEVTMIGSPHVDSMQYDEATGQAVWQMQNPLPAGTTGEVRIVVRFPPGATVDGTSAINEARIESSNAPTVESDPVEIIAEAENRMEGRKTLLNGNDAPVGNGENDVATYALQLCNPADGEEGNYNLSNIVFRDTLPAGVVIVDISDEGTEVSPGVVEWDIAMDEFAAADGKCLTRYITLRFPTPPFDPTSPDVTNHLDITAQAIDGSEVNFQVDTTHGLGEPVPGMSSTKGITNSSPAIGETIRYGFKIVNEGNTSISNYTITDHINESLDVQTIWLGRGNYPTTITVRYKTNIQDWQAVPSSPFSLNAYQQESISISELSLAANEYVTDLQWVYDEIPSGFKSANAVDRQTGFSAIIMETDRSGNPVEVGQILTNSADISYDYNGQGHTDLANNSVTIVEAQPQPQLEKDFAEDSIVWPGDTTNVTLTIGNTSTTDTDLLNPQIADLLDPNLEYVPGSWQLINNTGQNINQPVFTITENYKNTGKTLLKWSWNTQQPLALSSGQSVDIVFQVKVAASADPIEINNRGYLIGWDSEGIATDYCQLQPDENDLDNDGNTTETICGSNNATIQVGQEVSLSAHKYVKGDLDDDWLRYPEVGQTTVGGIFHYKMIVRNEGNESVTNIVIVDNFPREGDLGLIDLRDRESVWAPTMVKDINSPEGSTVWYSEVSNPCLAELDVVVPNCDSPDWSADFTENARSLKFDLGELVLSPEDEIEITWAMRAPRTDLPPDGSIAWNSFAYGATLADGSGSRVLSSEPIKVGISLQSEYLAGTGDSIVSPALLTLILSLISYGGYKKYHQSR